MIWLGAVFIGLLLGAFAGSVAFVTGSTSVLGAVAVWLFVSGLSTIGILLVQFGLDLIVSADRSR